MVIQIYLWREENKSMTVEVPDRIGEKMDEYISEFHKYIVSHQTCEAFYTYAFEYVDDRVEASEKISGFLYYLYLYHLEKGESCNELEKNVTLDPKYKAFEL